jgi:hypothetical protein
MRWIFIFHARSHRGLVVLVGPMAKMKQKCGDLVLLFSRERTQRFFQFLDAHTQMYARDVTTVNTRFWDCFASDLEIQRIKNHGNLSRRSLVRMERMG